MHRICTGSLRLTYNAQVSQMDVWLWVGSECVDTTYLVHVLDNEVSSIFVGDEIRDHAGPPVQLCRCSVALTVDWTVLVIPHNHLFSKVYLSCECEWHDREYPGRASCTQAQQLRDTFAVNIAVHRLGLNR